MKPLPNCRCYPLFLWLIIIVILFFEVYLFKRILPFKSQALYIGIIILIICTLAVGFLINYLNSSMRKLNKHWEFTQRFLGNYTDPIVIISNEIIEYINDGAYELIGFSNKNLMNTSVLSLIALDKSDEFLSFLDSKQLKEIVVEISEGNKPVIVNIKKLSCIGTNSYVLGLASVKSKKNSVDLKDTFISNISHEFNTPINVLYTAIQLQERYIENMSIADIRKYNKVMRKNCQRLIRLTNNIIDIGKIEQGILSPKLTSVNIVQIVEETCLSIVDFASEKNMELVFDTEKEELIVNCDIEFVERIILNLLSNCIKHGRIGSVININIGLDSCNFMHIKIKNIGEEIDKGLNSSIFHCFYKGDASFSRSKEGAGVGLYIAKALVELQGGKLFLATDRKDETVVYVVFPLIDNFFDERIDNISLLELEEKYIKEKAAIELSDIYT